MNETKYLAAKQVSGYWNLVYVDTWHHNHYSCFAQLEPLKTDEFIVYLKGLIAGIEFKAQHPDTPKED